MLWEFLMQCALCKNARQVQFFHLRSGESACRDITEIPAYSALSRRWCFYGVWRSSKFEAEISSRESLSFSAIFSATLTQLTQPLIRSGVSNSPIVAVGQLRHACIVNWIWRVRDVGC